MAAEEQRYSVMDVYKEIDGVRRNLGMHKWKSKRVQMKYCFRDRAHNVPSETEYCKVSYIFSYILCANLRKIKNKQAFFVPFLVSFVMQST